MLDVLWGLGGMVGILLIALALSMNRRAIRLRTVLGALGLQIAFGVLVLYWGPGRWVLEKLTGAVQAVIDSSADGIAFLFGPILPDDGVIFALQVLPVIIFVASLTAVLYHWGILQKVVALIGGGLGKLLGTGHAESVNAAANIFVGQTEAPLVIRPYISQLSKSGLFAVMVGGLSTVAGSVLVGYSLLGAPLEYLIAASFMAAPGALLMAKIILPEDDPDAIAAESATVKASATRKGGTQKDAAAAGAAPVAAADSADAARIDTARADTAVSSSAAGGSTAVVNGAAHGSATQRSGADGATADGATVDETATDAATADDTATDEPAPSETRHRNVIDAAASGAADGMKLAATIGAMLLAFISLIALINLIIGAVGGLVGLEGLTFEQILGWVFAPLMAMIGVPWGEAVQAGSFVGQKIVVNEFVAFTSFAPSIESFSPKSAAIITFALTGFANLGSLGILLGGLGSLAPERRGQIAELGIRAIIAGTLANLMSATIAGMLLG